MDFLRQEDIIDNLEMEESHLKARKLRKSEMRR